MLEWLARLPAATRRILIHINNTNPILDEDSAERAELTRRGIEVACGRHGDRAVTRDEPPWTRDEFEQQLRERGRAYHIHHPVQRDAELAASAPAASRSAAGWPTASTTRSTSRIKDAAILANCADREVRRNWVQRILDHDGYGEDAGGIESWLRLAEAVGLARAQVESLGDVVPGVRFAVDAYVNFARRAPWQEAVCSSLTELFAPEIHKQRLASWPQHYPWIEPAGLRLLPEPREPGAARRRVRPGAHARSLPHAAPRRSARSRCCSSSSTCCGR